MSVRVMGAAVLAVLVISGTVALERGLGQEPPGVEAAPPDVSGAWYCPHGGGDRWRAWVVVANPTAGDATIRLTTYGQRRPGSMTATVEPGVERYLEVEASELGSGSVVEYFGATVAAGMVVARPDGRGTGAEPCSVQAATSWFVADGSSLRGQGTRLIVVNPFDSDAVFDVTINAKGRILEPGPLSGVVLAPRRAVGFDLNRYALGEERVVATLRASRGKVVAAGLGLTIGGVRLTLGVREPSRSWILPGPPVDAPGLLTVLNPGTRQAPFRAQANNPEGQASVVEEASIGPRGSRSFEVAAGSAGLVARAEGRRPFVVARRMSRPDRVDRASTSGTPEATRRWVAMPASGPGGGTAVLLLQNPGAEPATAGLTLLTDVGRAAAPDLSDLTVAPGRTLVVDLAALVGDRPVAVLVEAEEGTLVAAQASHGRGGYAVALGVGLGLLWPE